MSKSAMGNTRSLALSAAALAAAVALPRAQAQAPMPAGTHVIVGRLVDAAGDTPVTGGVVTLVGFFGEGGRAVDTLPATVRVPTATAPRSVLTTTDGVFVFRDVAAGRYAISAAAFGYQQDDYRLRGVDVPDADAPVAVTLRVWKFGSISGTVVDENGEPVVGVPVRAMKRVMRGGAATLETTGDPALTDDRGVYRLSPLPRGRYVVAALRSSTTLPADAVADYASTPRSAPWVNLLKSGVQLRGFDGVAAGDGWAVPDGPALSLDPQGRPLAYASTFSPGTLSPSDAATFAIESGDARTNADIALRFGRAFRVTGTVAGPDGPMAALGLRLIPPNAADTAGMWPEGSLVAVTDSRGRFSFADVMAGAYTLRASYSVDDSRTGESVSLWATQPIGVTDRDVAGVVVNMRPGLRVRGRVVFSGGNTPPLSASDRTLLIGLRPIGAGVWRSFPAVVQEDGSFATLGDPPGRYEVRAVSNAGWVAVGVAAGGRAAADGLIELDATDLTGVVVTISTKPSRLSGTVASNSGAVESDADVVVFPSDTTSWRDGVLSSQRSRLVHASAAGAFETSGLPPGEYYVAAVAASANAELDAAFLARAVGGATKVTIGDADQKTVSLKTIALPARLTE